MEALNSSSSSVHAFIHSDMVDFLNISLVPGIILDTEEACGEQNTQGPSIPKDFIPVLKPGLSEVGIVNYGGVGRGV